MAAGIRPRLSAGELRRFGLTLAAAFAVLGGLVFWRGHGAVAMGLWGLAGILGLGALLVPSWLGPVERVWMSFALALSKVTTPIFMGIVYFLVILPIGWVMRRLGRDPLAPPGTDESYWVPHGSQTGGHSDMRRQF